ncbi:hypothetical protein T08_986 [Trichinella sp. T8]|nr:hypothetical protein T08_986 [Trichinella sp. T8]
MFTVFFQENFQESGNGDDFVPEEVSEDEDHIISDEEITEEESGTDIRPKSLTMKTRDISRPADAFNYFIDGEISEQGTWTDVTSVEVRAFFSLLLLASCYHGRKEPMLDMVSEENHCFQRSAFTATWS